MGDSRGREAASAEGEGAAEEDRWTSPSTGEIARAVRPASRPTGAAPTAGDVYLRGLKKTQLLSVLGTDGFACAAETSRPRLRLAIADLRADGWHPMTMVDVG